MFIGELIAEIAVDSVECQRGYVETLYSTYITNAMFSFQDSYTNTSVVLEALVAMPFHHTFRDRPRLYNEAVLMHYQRQTNRLIAKRSLHQKNVYSNEYSLLQTT